MNWLPFFLILLATPFHAIAAETPDCWPRLFKALQEKSAQATFQIPTFTPSPLGVTLRALLAEYLQSQGIETTFAGPAETVLQGQPPLKSWADLNDVALQLIDNAAKASKKKIKLKKIEPYLHHTSSSEALFNWAKGRLALEKGDRQSIDEAIKDFQKSLEKDYNYVPAYLGLAEAYAAQSVIDRLGERVGTGGKTPAWDQTQASRELAKAEILNPPMTDMKRERIRRYLDADNKVIETICKK